MAMTLDEAIETFGSAQTIPRDAIQWAREHWETVFPRLRALLPACMAGIDRTEETESALFFLLHLAGEKSDTRIHTALCHLLLDAALAELILGDATTETLPGLLISTYDGDPAAMQTVVESAAADGYMRGGALMALAWLTHTGRLPHDWMHDYLRRLFDTMQPRAGNPVWTDWVGAVSALGYTDLVPQVETAFRHEWVEPPVMALSHFQQDLRDTLANPGNEDGFERTRAMPFTDTIATLEHWRFGEAADDAAADDEWLTEPDQQAPYVNPMRHVGRNDPCPCGSGKKYKKCCLVA